MYTNVQRIFLSAAAALLASSAASAGVVPVINPIGTPLISPIGDPTTSYEFGRDVATSNGRIAVGAVARSAPEGRVFVFDEATGAFTREIAPPASSHELAADAFGNQVALDGDVLVVASNPWYALDDFSEVYVYNADTGALVTELLPFGDGVENSGSRGFGMNIAVGSGMIAVSQPIFMIEPGVLVGAVFLYDAETGAPIDRLIGTDVPSSAWDFFGASVAIHGDTIAVGRAVVNLNDGVGAPQDVFLFDAQTLAMRAHVLPPVTVSFDDDFGAVIALNGDTLVVCAPGDDSFGQGSGSVFTFDAATGAYRNTLALVHPTGPGGSNQRMNAEINEDGLIAITSRANGAAGPAVRVFDDQTGVQVASLELDSMTPDPEFGMGLAFVGNKVYAGNSSGTPGVLDSVYAFVIGSVITQQPGHYATDVENEMHTFSVVATNAVAYQWFRDGVPVVDGPFSTGATTDSLTVLANSATQGVYVCEVMGITASLSLSDPAFLLYQGVDGEPACDYDFDLNGVVDSTDLASLLAFWGPCPE